MLHIFWPDITMNEKFTTNKARDKRIRNQAEVRMTWPCISQRSYRIIKEALDGNPQGSRGKGRPRRMW